MSLSRSIAASVIWGKALQIAALIFNLSFSVLIVRRLGKSYGDYAFLDLMIGVGIFVSALGLAEAAARFLPEARTRISERFARNLFLALNLLRFVITLVLISFFLLFSGWLADIFNVPAIRDFAPIAAVLFFFRSIWEALDSHFNATLLWWRGLVARSLSQIIQFIAIFPLLNWLNSVILAVILAQIVGLVLGIVVYLWLARHSILRPADSDDYQAAIKARAQVPVLAAVDGGLEPDYTPAPDLSTSASQAAQLKLSSAELKEMYAYTLTVWLITVFTFGLNNQIDILLMQYFLQNVQLLGYYRLAIFIVTNLNGVVVVAGRTFLPALAGIYSREGTSGMRQAITIFNKINLLLVLPSLAALAVTAPNLIAMLFGEEMTPTAAIVAIYSIFLLLCNTLGYGINLYSLYILRRQHLVLWERMFFGLFNIGLDIILIPIYGPVGAIFSTGLCSFCVILIEYWLLSSELNFRLPRKFLFKMCGVTALAGLVASLPLFISIKPGLIPLLIQGGLFGVVFVVGLVVVRVLEPADKIAIADSLARRPRLARTVNKLLTFF